jgi:hypothetical protein
MGSFKLDTIRLRTEAHAILQSRTMWLQPIWCSHSPTRQLALPAAFPAEHAATIDTHDPSTSTTATEGDASQAIAAEARSETCHFCGRTQVQVASFRAADRSPLSLLPLCGCNSDVLLRRTSAARREFGRSMFAHSSDWWTGDADQTVSVKIEHMCAQSSSQSTTTHVLDVARQFFFPWRLGRAVSCMTPLLLCNFSMLRRYQGSNLDSTGRPGAEPRSQVPRLEATGKPHRLEKYLQEWLYISVLQTTQWVRMYIYIIRGARFFSIGDAKLQYECCTGANNIHTLL